MRDEEGSQLVPAPREAASPNDGALSIPRKPEAWFAGFLATAQVVGLSSRLGLARLVGPLFNLLMDPVPPFSVEAFRLGGVGPEIMHCFGKQQPCRFVQLKALAGQVEERPSHRDQRSGASPSTPQVHRLMRSAGPPQESGQSRPGVDHRPAS